MCQAQRKPPLFRHASRGGQSKPGNLGIQTNKLAQGMEVDGCSLSNAGPACMGGKPPQKSTFNPRYKGGNQKEGKWESKTKKPAQGMEADGHRQSNACGNAKCVGWEQPSRLDNLSLSAHQGESTAGVLAQFRRPLSS